MAVPLLDLKAQHGTIRDEVLAAIMPIIDGQTFILGEPVERIETLVAQLSHTTHAIGCASGTDAILLALRALDVGPNDAVVTTPFTFFATAGAVHNVGARPVFVDIDPDTFNISPEAVDEEIRNTPDARAVIAVDLFGQMAAIDDLRDSIPEGMPIIEDAAQSIGASRQVAGKKVMAGEAVDIGTFSFFPSKNLGGYGDGGMIVTQNDELAQRLRKLRTHGSVRTYFHEEVGYNSRLDALQAAVLAAKLPHLEAWSAARRRNASVYDQAFADLDGVRTPVIDARNQSIYNQYTLRAERRDELQQFLRKRGIGNSIYYPLPLHLQPCFAYLGYKEGDLPHSERASRQVISLPVYPELTDSQRDEVISAVRAFYGR
jgi:dTDP-4-amino-4,6-dideoxygalactose transaminase